MATHKHATSIKPVVEEEEVESVGIMALYKEMLERIESIHKVALALANDENLAQVLKSAEAVKANIVAVMEKLEMEKQMEMDVKEYESRKVSDE